MTNQDFPLAYWSGGDGKPSGALQGGFYNGNESSAVQAPAVSSERMIAGMRDGLGLFGRLAVDKASKAETRRVAGEAIVQMLAAQKERVIYKIGLDLDASKKKLFVEALREGSRIEQEIAERSTEFERRLMDLAMDEGVLAHQRKLERIAKLDASRSSGLLDEAGYQQLLANVERWSVIFFANLNAKVEVILRNHAHQIERTLLLFRERAIQGHAP